MSSLQNENHLSFVNIEKSNHNFPMDSFLEAMDNRNIDVITLLKNKNSNININHSGKRDIVLEMYKKDLLTPKRLKYIPKYCSNYLYISSSFMMKIIKDNQMELLEVVFKDFKFYDNDFIQWLLFQYKNKTAISTADLNRHISNEIYRISSSNHYMENFHNGFFRNSCRKGKKNLIRYLMEHGADINKGNCNGSTALFDACYNGNDSMVRYLIELGADINKVDNDGETPLFNACESGNESVVRYLIELGVDINKENREGETPLFNACESGNEKIVRYLIEHGADVNKENRNGNTVLFKACEQQQQGNGEIVKYLVELGMDINKKNRDGKTSLVIACENNNKAIINYLIKHKATV